MRQLHYYLAAQVAARGNPALLDDLAGWVHWYNHHRGHMAHNGGTPMSSINNVPTKHN